MIILTLLEQMSTAVSQATNTAQWWTSEQSGMVGGIAGSVLGILGGVFGTMCGILIPKGKGVKPLLWGIRMLTIASVVFLCVGAVAIAQNQPYHVWYPLVLIGGLTLFVFGIWNFLLPYIASQHEQRRLHAREFRHSQ